MPPGALARRCPFTAREAASLLRAMLDAAGGYGIGEVELTLTDDSGIARLNERFLGCRGPTNIITFPGDSDIPGTMFMSLECLNRECLLYRQRRDKHFIRLLAHGVAHLAGLDHGPEMAILESLCLSAVSNQTQTGNKT